MRHIAGTKSLMEGKEVGRKRGREGGKEGCGLYRLKEGICGLLMHSTQNHASVETELQLAKETLD